VTHALQEVAKEPDLSIALVHGPDLSPCSLKVLVLEKQHRLGPLLVAVFAGRKVLPARKCFQVRSSTATDATNDHCPPRPALVSQAFALLVFVIECARSLKLRSMQPHAATPTVAHTTVFVIRGFII